MEVVDAIATAPRDSRDFPNAPVTMTKVTVDEGYDARGGRSSAVD